MKKMALTVMLVLCSFSLMQAQKCKPKETETDDFTEETIEYWGNTLTSMGYFSYGVEYYPSMYLYKEKGETKILMMLVIKGKLSDKHLPNNHTWFEEGASFMLKLENEVLTFTMEESVVRQGGSTSAQFASKITPEQIEKLNTQRIKMGRVYPFIDSEDMIFEFNTSKGRDKAIKKQIACFLKG